MKEPNTSAGLSWKWGFLHNKLKGNIGTQALPQVQVKRISKIQCPHIKKPGNKFQLNFPTDGAVHDGSDLAIATDPAPSSLLNVTIATTPTIGICQRRCQHDPTTTKTTGSGMTPQLSPKHDDGHIHRASPVRGLPPERQPINGTSAIVCNDQMRTSTDMMEASLVARGLGQQQNRCKSGKPTTATKQSAIDHPTPLGDPPYPLPKPDATQGPDAALSTVDARFGYQISPMNVPSTQLHPLDADDRQHTPFFTQERPLEQPQDACLSKHTSTDPGLEIGAQLEGHRARRKRFAWNQGFLTAHKPPSHRPTPASTPHRRNPSVNQGTDKTPTVLPAVATLSS